MNPSSYNPASSTTAVTFPLIVSIIGAETPLGQKLFEQLLNSERVDKVHAIVPDSFPLLDTLPEALKRKARVYITSLTKSERLDVTLNRIAECDIAFCVLSTDRHAFNSLSKHTFRAINYHAPTKFIRRMFKLGVLHLTVLSHTKADHDSPSEFYALKGDLEKFVRAIRHEAGSFSPIISIFKMPSQVMSANSKQNNSSLTLSASTSSARVGRSNSFRDSRRTGTGFSSGVLQFNSRDVIIKDVVAAMNFDAFYKASIKPPPGESKKRSLLEIFDAEDVQRITEQVKGQGPAFDPL